MRKSGKRPTRRQKDIISKELFRGKPLNPDNWLVMKSLPTELHIVHRESLNTRVIRLERGA